MSHLKKTQMPTSWPVARKGRGKRFVAVPSHSVSNGISLLFLLRDVLGIAKTRKEARHMTLGGMVLVNNIVRKDENFPMQVFDVLGLVADGEKKYFRLEIVNRKFKLVEISEKDAGRKVVKISGKKILRGNKTQMNLEDGQNVLSDLKFSVGDSVVLRTIEGRGEIVDGRAKIEKILPLKVGAKVEIVVGKHAGEKGELVGIGNLVRGKSYAVKLEDGREVSLPFKTVLVIG